MYKNIESDFDLESVLSSTQITEDTNLLDFPFLFSNSFYYVDELLDEGEGY